MTQAFIQTSVTQMEWLKHKLFAALYANDSGRLLRCYFALYEKAKAKGLTETDEKYLRQVQEGVKKICFRPGDLNRKNRAPAPLNDIYNSLQALMRDRARRSDLFSLDYNTWKEAAALETWQADLVFQTAITFQLTSGCANFCRRCNEWALPRVRGHFDREAAETILQKLLAQGNRDLALYGGSDPLDWEDGSATLIDLLNAFPEKSEFSLLTKIPKGKEPRLSAIIGQGIDIAVSLTNRNRGRIEALENRLGLRFTKQHATPDLLIAACLDEDFATVKPSITDSYGTEISPDGVCIIIPTFTSALYPFGHKKIPVTKATAWFPVKRIGRMALLQDYFKPLQVIGQEGRSFYLSLLLDVQVENILLDNGDYNLTPPGMRSVKEYFEVFDEAARLKRRANTLSVMKRLKKDGLNQTSYRDLSQSQKTAYRKKISAHLEFTRKDKVLEARRCAAVFFLAAAMDYIRANPIKREIIAFLTRQEFEAKQEIRTFHDDFIRDYLDPDTDAWQLFRTQVLSLVHEGTHTIVADFIASCPAVFDPELDLFVSGKTPRP